MKGMGEGSWLSGGESIASWKRVNEEGGELEVEVDEDLIEEADEDVLSAMEKDPSQFESV
jgi:hypothetical protein